MNKAETKQEWAIQQFNALKPEFLKLLLGAPEYGATKLTLYFYEGSIKRIVHKYKESVIPVENES